MSNSEEDEEAESSILQLAFVADHNEMDLLKTYVLVRWQSRNEVCSLKKKLKKSLHGNQQIRNGTLRDS